EWTNKPVLHIFPPWNSEKGKTGWKEGDIVDVWAYTNCDEVELFLDGKPLGIKSKSADDLHLIWSIPFKPGNLKAVGKKNGKVVLTTIDKTAGTPEMILLLPDRENISADGQDLSFVTVKITDKESTMVPYADNLVNFNISGPGKIIGVDNGSETSHEPFKADYRKAFNGLCLVAIQSDKNSGKITLTASSDGLKGASVVINSD
ncbi:MAG: DUF4982 domain-containing protein, partial [Ignavibacteriaceae bacterium]